MAFYADRMTEAVITGNSFIKVQALDPKLVRQDTQENNG